MRAKVAESLRAALGPTHRDVVSRGNTALVFGFALPDVIEPDDDTEESLATSRAAMEAATARVRDMEGALSRWAREALPSLLDHADAAPVIDEADATEAPADERGPGVEASAASGAPLQGGGALRIRIAGEWIEADNIRGFLEGVLRRASEVGGLSPLVERLPLLIGRRAHARRYIVALTPRHADEAPFRSPHEVRIGDRVLYVEAHRSYEGARQAAVRICEAMGLAYHLLPIEDRGSGALSDEALDGA